MQSFLFTNERGEPIQADPISYEIGREAKRAYHRAYMREWRKTHPMNAEQRRKDNARSYAKEYVKRGKLTREPCFVCDADDAEMHHPDYDKPLKIVWLCRQHHLYLHAMGLAA